MMRSLFSGVSGLKSHQTRMDVIGNNIANINTVGFKGSRVTFQDMLNQTISGAASPQGGLGGMNPQQVGLGVGIASIDTVFTDGSVQATGKNTDLCISGNGFFVVSDGAKEYYTRNGAFEFDKQGNYVLPGSGLQVKGWMADANGNVSTSGQTGNIVVPKGQTMPAVESKKVVSSGNVSAEAPVGYIYTMTATATKNMAVGDSVYDAQGKIIGTVTKEALAGGDFTFETKDVATDPPAVIYDSSTHNLTALLNVAPTTSLYSVTVVAGAGETPQLDDPVYDTTQNPPKLIGKVTVAATGAGGQFTFATASMAGGPPLVTEIATGGNNGVGGVPVVNIVGTPLEIKSVFTMTAKAEREMKVGEIVYDNLGKALGTVTVGGPAGATFTFQTSAITGTPPTVPAVVRDGRDAPATAIPIDPTTDFVSKKGGLDNSKQISFTAFDSQGIAHIVTGNLIKSATNEWTFVPVSPADSGATVTADDIVVRFDANGNFISGAGALTITPVDPPLGSGVITLNVDFSGLKQYGGATTVSTAPDGNGAGTLDRVDLDSSGMIVGSFSNGLRKNLAQVALATFNNPAGLEKAGSSLYTKSNNSGEVQINAAGTGGAGKLTAAAIEMSNVNLSDQFSDMIITQRGFQSNSKIITVSDEMIETLVNMKR